MGELLNLPNIGAELERQLNAVGISSPAELSRVGAKEAWLRILQSDPSACIQRLMALEGAIQGVKKSMLADNVKQELKQFYSNAKHREH